MQYSTHARKNFLLQDARSPVQSLIQFKVSVGGESNVGPSRLGNHKKLSVSLFSFARFNRDLVCSPRLRPRSNNHKATQTQVEVRGEYSYCFFPLEHNSRKLEDDQLTLRMLGVLTFVDCASRWGVENGQGWRQLHVRKTRTRALSARLTHCSSGKSL